MYIVIIYINIGICIHTYSSLSKNVSNTISYDGNSSYTYHCAYFSRASFSSPSHLTIIIISTGIMINMFQIHICHSQLSLPFPLFLILVAANFIITTLPHHFDTTNKGTSMFNSYPFDRGVGGVVVPLT